MFKKLVVAAIAALAGVEAAIPRPTSPPATPQQYHLTATMSLPYADIVEPVEVTFDGIANKQRVDYYGGLDKYIFRGDLGKIWQINPVINTNKCFETSGQVALTNWFPDLTNFVLQPGTKSINGQSCYDFQYVETDGQKTNTYDFYIATEDGHPVQYHMYGFDSLLGSHYDDYRVDYQTVTFGPVDSTKFDHPAIACGSFPGPGAHFVNPLEAVAEMFPNTRTVPVGEVHPAFLKFMKTHNKDYSDEVEMRIRETVFLQNMHYINSGNRKNTYRMSINHLADLTEEEMNARRGVPSSGKGGKSADNQAHSTHKIKTPKQDRPTSFDWRPKGAVTDVQDQGVCGSCWSFGSTGTIEGAYFLKYGKLQVFAQQELMDCSWEFGNNACDGGEDFRAYQWIMQNGGLATKQDYGVYLMADGQCHTNNVTSTAKIASYVNITSGSEDAVLDAIVNQGPISVAIDASHKSLSFYASGVYYEPQCGNGLDSLDHAVLAVGYGTDNGEDYWIVKNSWSTHWGDQGYVKMSRKNNNCGVATSATYVILE